MKRLLIAAVLLGFSLSMCFVSSSLTARVENRVGKPLEKTIELYDSGTDGQWSKSFLQAKESWDEIKEITALFSSHSSVDEIDEQMVLADSLFGRQNDQFISRCSLCLLKIQNLCDSERLTPKALF